MYQRIGLVTQGCDVTNLAEIAQIAGLSKECIDVSAAGV